MAFQVTNGDVFKINDEPDGEPVIGICDNGRVVLEVVGKSSVRFELIISADGLLMSPNLPLKTLQRAIQIRLAWEAEQEWKLPDGCEWRGWKGEKPRAIAGVNFSLWLSADRSIEFNATGAGSGEFEKLVTCRELMAKRHGVEL